MTARTIDGRAVAARVRADVARGVAGYAARTGRPPGLATVLVGDDPASALYVGGKQKATQEVGMAGFDHRLPVDARREDVAALVERAQRRPGRQRDHRAAPAARPPRRRRAHGRVDPGKDVDGLTTLSAGLLALGRPGLRPCTPAGLHAPARGPGRRRRGARGRRGRALEPLRQADGPASARGERDGHRLPLPHARPGRRLPARRRARRRRRAGPRWCAPTGSSRAPSSSTWGRTARRAGSWATWPSPRSRRSRRPITPVPGGVGPMTIACLLRNTLEAAERAQAVPA